MKLREYGLESARRKLHTHDKIDEMVGNFHKYSKGNIISIRIIIN